MNFRYIFILVLSMFFLSFGLPEKIKKKVFKEIKSTYDVEKFEFSAFKISDTVAKELPSKFETDNFFEIRSENNRIGFAYVAKAPSKTAQFDYLILLDSDLIVKKAKVLIYREEYGGEIGSKRWLRQFIGKTPEDELKYEQDIVAISGATISVRSMTSAVNDVLRSLKMLQSKNIL
ncbi:FMN-binding protein [Psychroserpens luteolus]|uniref:FMN-binding protein n=1 Tax=Psychroserpens luteolus TaxID=2855840 RepID=UPI001E46A099|nr:FMN-binding protein [Psychroserpens luteolus]MCD2259671.1 FMN-binding protein [Psychroserpens luteolus]